MVLNTIRDTFLDDLPPPYREQHRRALGDPVPRLRRSFLPYLYPQRLRAGLTSRRASGAGFYVAMWCAARWRERKFIEHASKNKGDVVYQRLPLVCLGACFL